MKTFFLFAIAILMISCNNSRQPNYPFIPQHRATDDLQVYDGKWRKQLLGNGVVIECTIVNKSNSLNNKDVKLVVKYYSVTHTLMGTYYYVIYQYLNAGKLIKAKLKGPTTDFQSLGTVSVDVQDATQY